MQELEIESRGFKGHGGKREGAGRPLGSLNRLTQPIKELAARYGPDALRTLVLIMKDGESEQARIMAARELLDRGYGKPRQPKEDSDRRVRVVVNR